MTSKSVTKKRDLVTVKVDRSVVEQVKNRKDDPYMPIGVYFEHAALEKLKKAKK